MRSVLYLMVLFLSCTMIIIPTYSYAQDTAKTAENATKQKKTQPPAEKKSIYARASDTQLKEAQKYYRLCTSTLSLSSIKDCKCAAAEFLETRLNLGDKASVDEIIKKNLNTCLKNEKQLTLPKGSIDYSKVPKAYIEESLYIYSYCNENPTFSTKYDCQCYAAEFLTKRIDEGNRKAQNDIMISLRHECKNVVGTTGSQYAGCMSQLFDTSTIGDGVTQKDYCECVARQWAASYRNYQGDINNPSLQTEMTFSAYMQCKKPDKYNNN